MQYQAAKSLRSWLLYFVCTVLSVVLCTALFALPAAAQVSPLAGTPAQGTNPDSPSSPPDLVTIAAEGCTVSEGASITLEDGDGTEARFVDGQLGIEITSTGDQIMIEGPNDDYIGDHAVSTSDPGFDTDGDYAVVTTTGIACEGGGTTPDEPPATEDLDGDESLEGDDTTAAGDQYDATTDDTATTAKDGIPSEKKIIDVPKQKVLIDTGGPPLLLLGAALMCLAGAAIAGQLLRVLRR
jgi:hypothetical protein